MFRPLFVIPLAALSTSPALAAPKSQDVTPISSANAAAPKSEDESSSPLIAKSEARLNRARFPIGQIDGVDGDNYRQASRSVAQANNLRDTGKLDAETWSASSAFEPVLEAYTISGKDVAGPFERQIPEHLAAAGAGSVPSEPAANGKNAETLVSVSGMTSSDYDECVSDLTSRGVVFEQLGAVTQEGCQLSGAIKLATIATPFGDVGISGKPAMLCSFGLQFSGWVRDVGAPLTLAYTGQKLTQIEAGQAFACRARYDKPGAIPSEHAKGDAIDITSFVLADNRRIPVKQQDIQIFRGRATSFALCGRRLAATSPRSSAQEPNSAHESHLHFDTGVHGAVPNYRICE